MTIEKATAEERYEQAVQLVKGEEFENADRETQNTAKQAAAELTWSTLEKEVQEKSENPDELPEIAEKYRLLLMRCGEPVMEIDIRIQSIRESLRL